MWVWSNNFARNSFNALRFFFFQFNFFFFFFFVSWRNRAIWMRMCEFECFVVFIVRFVISLIWLAADGTINKFDSRSDGFDTVIRCHQIKERKKNFLRFIVFISSFRTLTGRCEMFKSLIFDHKKKERKSVFVCEFSVCEMWIDYFSSFFFLDQNEIR